LTGPVTDAARANGLDVVPGKFVLEVRIPGLSKADALANLLDPDPPAALFAGDDIGDLPAFQELRRWVAKSGNPGITIGVGDVSSVREAADIALDSPAELSLLLQGLASH
jgi:trehalose 6-phosphate phosphatase